jgi:predicted dehydrogenase
MIDAISTREIRFGIAGAGIRDELFAQAIAQMPGAKLVAVCDVNEPRAAELANRCGAKAYSTHTAMLDHHNLDALIVATPDFGHRDIAVAGAERGLHLMIEKPLATTIEEARQISAAVRRLASSAWSVLRTAGTPPSCISRADCWRSDW